MINDKLEQALINQEYVFKTKAPREYYLVKASRINKSENTIIIISNITKIKELERTSKKIRAIFFSSVAHELRTPLNSILPITKQLLDRHQDDPKSSLYLQIVLNSAHHLSNLIEDALDMSRIENNKFEVFRTPFKVRDTLKEVQQIMEFQCNQKGVELHLSIDQQVPY